MKEFLRKMKILEPKRSKLKNIDILDFKLKKLTEIHHFLRISGHQIGLLDLGIPKIMENNGTPQEN